MNHMYRFFTINSVVFLLFVSLLANGIDWAFHGEAFVHELDHHPHALSETQVVHLKLHQHDEFTDDKHSDITTYYCLSSAGQFQPFFFILPTSIPDAVGKETLAAFNPVFIPELILDLPFQPPRKIFPS
jgi:hypothetical protein